MTTTETLVARHYASGEPIALTLEKGRIASVRPLPAQEPWPTHWAAPAFFDVQINGALGHGFSSTELNHGDVQVIADACQGHGISAFCPTLITNSLEALTHGFSILRSAVEAERTLADAMPCFHLEGPYISPEDGFRGAHPREHVRPPCWNEFLRLQEAAGGRIRLVTLAPEAEGAIRFIEKLTRAGVVVALGHTAASGDCIRDAISAGARLSTHLGNGCAAMLPRHENVIWQQLDADELWASLIVDGQHLPAPVVRCMLRAKTPARTILTCDASTLAGLPPGRYRAWGQELEITPAGRIVVAGTPYLAGSWAFLDHCVRSTMSIAGIDLAQAVGMASIQPRELLGLPCPRLEPGHPADLVLFDRDVNGLPRVRDTLVAGVHHPFKLDLQESQNDAARASDRGTPPACGNA